MLIGGFETSTVLGGEHTIGEAKSSFTGRNSVCIAIRTANLGYKICGGKNVRRTVLMMRTVRDIQPFDWLISPAANRGRFASLILNP